MNGIDTETEAMHSETEIEDDANNIEVIYHPVFSDTVRTIIYVVCMIALIISTGLYLYDHTREAVLVIAVAGILADGFAVAYNPSRKTRRTE